MQPGLCGYDAETVLVGLEAIKRMLPTLNGKPVYIHHRSLGDLPNMEDHAVGYITDSFIDPVDGWLWSKVIIIKDEGHEAILQKEWSASNAYVPTDFEDGGKHVNVPFDRKITNGRFTHLAITPTPRYGDAKIYTPGQYEARNTQLVNSLAQPQTEEKKDSSVLKFFKNKQEEVSEISADTSVELTNSNGDKTVVSVQQMIDAVSGATKAKPQTFKVGDKEMTAEELVNSYQALQAKSEEDDAALKAAVKEKAEADAAAAVASEQRFDELSNAHTKEAKPIQVATVASQLQRGQTLYGSTK